MPGKNKMQTPAFLGINDDEWERGVTLDRWAKERDFLIFEAVALTLGDRRD